MVLKGSGRKLRVRDGEVISQLDVALFAHGCRELVARSWAVMGIEKIRRILNLFCHDLCLLMQMIIARFALYRPQNDLAA